MNWLSQNWDKVFGIIVSAIIGGVIGFFSGVFVLQEKISKLENRVGVLEATIENIESSTEETAQKHGARIDELFSLTHSFDIRITAIDSKSSLLIIQNQTLLQSSVK